MDSLRTHRKDKHSDGEGQFPPPPTFHCRDCDKVYKKKKYLNKHRKDEHSDVE